jgi:hypothetical protein
MLSEDDRPLVGMTELFASDGFLADRLAEALTAVRVTVDAADDDSVLSCDHAQWSRRLADEFRIDPPRADVATAELELERPAAAAAAAGVGLAADDRPVAATYRLRISIPVSGEIELLRSQPAAAARPLRGALESGGVVREWLWPAERGAAAFDREVDAFTAAVADGAGQIVLEVDRFNAALPERAHAAIEERRAAILSERAFVGELSRPVKRGQDPRSGRGRLLTRVAKWQAPPRNLLLSALVLLVLPWDDVLIDVLYAGDPKASALVVYVIWILFDMSLIWVVLASGRMVRPAFVYAGIAAALDVILGVVYYWLSEYSTGYMVITAVLQVAYLALITTVMWARLKGPVRTDRWQGRWLGLGRPLDTAEAQRRPSLFLFVVPLLVSIAVAYGAAYAASLTCARGGGGEHGCGAYGPPIGSAFFDESAHIIAILLVALAIEARLLVGGRRQEERSLVAVTALGLAVGIAAALTAAAAHSETLPLTFWLTVQALALGLTTLLMLPFLGDPAPPPGHEP